MFEDPPPKSDSGSMANQKCLEITVKMLKMVAYLFTFVIVLGSGVIAKGTTLFMTSQLRKDRVITYCNRDIGKYMTGDRILVHISPCTRPVIFNLFRSPIPRYVLSSTLYPQSCWCIIQVRHNLKSTSK